ncbi:hypothetical protein KFE98_08555 [bacterium SCSIO 12741]|nr:hypothetical protein KFE98_08555 [bacterium SCSIO 12741]
MERRIWIIAIVVYALAAWFSVGYFHPDEHHQLLEFAATQLDLREAQTLPWEFEQQMRPTLQVYIVVAVYKVMDVIGLGNPFWVATFLRFISAALALWAAALLIRNYRETWKWRGAFPLFLILTLLLWFNVFNHVRFSSENWSGVFFMFGFAWALGDRFKHVGHGLIIGFLLGLSFLFRYQSILLIGGLALWLLVILRMPLKKWMSILAGGLLAIGLGWLTDYHFYGEPVFTFYNYLEQNIVEGKAAEFGVEPWWYYITQVVENGVPPFSLFYVVAVFWVFITKPKSVLTWTFVPFLLIHSLTAHKELRFLFPVVGFASLFLMEFLDGLFQRRSNWDSSKTYKWIKGLFLGVNYLIVAVICFKPVEINIPLYQYIYNEYPDGAQVFAHKDHPYLGAAEIRYYARPSLEVFEGKEESELDFDSTKPVLLVTADKEMQAKMEAQSPAVYSALPDWILAFNVNGWVDRTTYYKVYELPPPEKRTE